ncbi:MAG: YceI family protein [Verrucomicrobia bacterium]|nr:YceI family protein [Verrucomicrobiota bacterium]
MKSSIFSIRNVVLGLVLAALALPTAAETWTRYQGQPRGSKLKLEGTSTLHDWSVEGKLIAGFMELESNFPLDPAAKPPADAKLNAKVEVKIPVTSLLSGTQLMDEVMYEAMKQKQYKDIQYRLKQISVKTDAPAGALQFNAVGEFSIAGMLRTNSMVVTIERVDATRLKVKGDTAFKMSDYGIKVRAPLALPLKVGDDVKVAFEWLAAQKAEAAKPAEK